MYKFCFPNDNYNKSIYKKLLELLIYNNNNNSNNNNNNS